ncbi:MAG: molecular chaperone DnaJ [Pseudomonadota bacterium]|nr:molecular chaperone DnaJ [Pseudomonadota bacterium]
MAKRDYYEVLQVSRTAGEAEIKKAYRRWAMKYHPDRNPDDAEAETRFKEVREAYDVLSDARKRAAYDQFGHAGVDPAAAGGPGGGGFADFGDIFGDVFGDIFGQARGRQRSYRGADLRVVQEIDLEEAARGCRVELRVPVMGVCEVCEGSGAEPDSKVLPCPTCDGRGQVRVQQGFFSLQQTCPRCHGSGRVVADPCHACRGEGRQQREKTLSVKVPAGVDTGDRIRLAGEGETAPQGGAPGDLYVQIKVRPHPIFQREGRHLLCDAPVSFTTLALGGEMEVPTLEGKAAVRIPGGTQTGKVFRLRGKGLPSVRGAEQGDLLCRVQVETPVNLTSEQKELLRQFEELVGESGDRHSPQKASWLDSVRSFFERFAS